MNKKFVKVTLFVILLILIAATVYFGYQNISYRIELKNKETIINVNNDSIANEKKEINSLEAAISTEGTNNADYENLEKWQARDKEIQSLIQQAN